MRPASSYAVFSILVRKFWWLRSFVKVIGTFVADVFLCARLSGDLSPFHSKAASRATSGFCTACRGWQNVVKNKESFLPATFWSGALAVDTSFEVREFDCKLPDSWMVFVSVGKMVSFVKSSKASLSKSCFLTMFGGSRTFSRSRNQLKDDSCCKESRSSLTYNSVVESCRRWLRSFLSTVYGDTSEYLIENVPRDLLRAYLLHCNVLE